MSERPRRIIIGIRLVEALREVVDGVIRYVKTHHVNWQLQCVDTEDMVHKVQQGAICGVITNVTSRHPERIEYLRQSGVPTVNMLHDATPSLPSVLSDDCVIGQRGAEYFIGHGFRNFAFLGVESDWSRNRQAGFTKMLRASGHSAHLSEMTFPHPDNRDLDSTPLRSRLRQWITKLPKPVAVMVASDFIARSVLWVCEAANIQVPEEVSILGVDNILTTCELTSVPLSSVSQNYSCVGFETAKLLDELMARRRPRTRILIPPGPIVVRRSTNAFAFDDKHVATAMRLIHEHSGEGFCMKDLMNQLPVSRTWLDMQFKAMIGHTPSEEIRRVRLNRVRSLLANTDLSVQQIARQCGFGTGENLTLFFRRAHEVSPMEYRRRRFGEAPFEQNAFAPGAAESARRVNSVTSSP